jgi:membrane protein required for colicin V production
VLLILGVSAFLGLLRGLVKEVLSLIAFVLAFTAAIWWGPVASGALDFYIDNALLRSGLAYAVVFVAVLLLVGLVNITLGTLIEKTGLTPADHGLGALFGLLRGTVLVLILVVLAGYTELPKEPWWQDARFSRAVVQGVQQIKLMLPPSLATWLPY